MNVSGCLIAQGVSVARDNVPILQQVDFSLHRGEVLGLLGPNGAGKTTLLSVLAGVSAADSGLISFDGRPVAQLSHQRRAQAVSYLPQDAPVHWPLTVENVVALGRLPYRQETGNTATDDAAAIEQALALTEMTDYRHRTLNTLSGGERMRALVARMLAVQADVLLADEPVTGLDPYFQLEFMDLFVAQARADKGVALVLHDLALAARYCDRVLLMHHGQVVGDGPPDEILSEAHLQSVYRVEAVRGAHAGESFVLPWKRTQ